ncbi:Six-bladed beta-propeller TolB-like protein [Gracilaria domingensis]|nr:Six-bladed beta-propeller TolB-like protein [Gracilaria domingensis]
MTPRRELRESVGVPTQERLLRLERALAAAILQERYSDAANLRDALQAARTSDPLLAKRAELQAAVDSERFLDAARLRDELAALTERFSKRDAGRRVDRIIVLRGRAEPDKALRAATVSRDGAVQLGLVPEVSEKNAPPRVYLQPTWSPSGDFVAVTEISFSIDLSRLGRGVAIADSSAKIIVMNAFDGSIVRSVPFAKPPFFYFWSPDGRRLTLLSNGPGTSAATVALSAIQVVAPPGGGGLDMDTVTGPLATGHPFLYDICPRDSNKTIVHMGDKSTVALVPISSFDRENKCMTTKAGSFGAPQWHPNAGKDGREVVLFVERDKPGTTDPARGPTPARSKTIPEQLQKQSEEEGRDKSDADKAEAFEKFLTNSTNLLENVLRKGAESLGLAPKTSSPESETAKDEPLPSASAHEGGDDDQLKEKVRRLLPKRPSGVRDQHWSEPYVTESMANRLVMCDVDNPQLKRVIARFTGIMAFKLSPNGRYLATLVINPTAGADELTLCTGDFSPDSVAETRPPNRLKKVHGEADIILSTPYTRVLAFFWSPDSSKLLFLTSLRGSRVGAAQWATFDLESNKVVRYEKFIMSGIYMHCLNFFDQFATSMTPWSPDSDAFCYPGRALTPAEIEKDLNPAPTAAPALSALFMQRDSSAEGKRFNARVQQVPVTTNSIGKVEPEEPVTIVENVEYACWSPC